MTPTDEAQIETLARWKYLGPTEHRNKQCSRLPRLLSYGREITDYCAATDIVRTIKSGELIVIMEQHEGYTKLTAEEFLTIGDRLLQEQKDFVAIFSGSEDAQGINWCPDCVEAKPHILKTLIPTAKSKNIPVYYVGVGDRPVWKNPQHPLRVHPVFKVDCVPTGLFLKDGKADNRLREGEFLLDDLLQEFLE